MKKDFTYYLETALVFFKKNILASVVNMVVKSALGLQGILATVAAKVLLKLVTAGIIKIEDKIDSVQDKKAIEEIKKETSKPLDQVDRAKLDELEREILEGK
jgi:hypothetical protein